MKRTEGITPSQHAAMVFVCALALVLCLPAECDADPCDENKIRQQSTAVNVKEKTLKSEAAKEEYASTEALELKKVEAKPVNSEKAKAENVTPELTGEVKQEKSGAKSEEVVAIDMEILTKRLKKTKAIGFFTKLAIHNDVSDLMGEVKRYRKKSMLASKIKEIRESFEGLLMKIVALLDDDPELSRDLYVGRESIWKSLLEVKV